jgi:hypothetical protein
VAILERRLDILDPTRAQPDCSCSVGSEPPGEGAIRPIRECAGVGSAQPWSCRQESEDEPGRSKWISLCLTRVGNERQNVSGGEKAIHRAEIAEIEERAGVLAAESEPDSSGESARYGDGRWKVK